MDQQYIGKAATSEYAEKQRTMRAMGDQYGGGMISDAAAEIGAFASLGQALEQIHHVKARIAALCVQLGGPRPSDQPERLKVPEPVGLIPATRAAARQIQDDMREINEWLTHLERQAN